MADPRRAYVVGVARELLGVSKGSVVGEEAMEKFLNQSDVVLLQCSVGDDQSLLFSTSIGVPGAKQDKQINLVKRNRGALKAESIQSQLMMSTIVDSPLLSLYITLKAVYLPKLSLGTNKINPRLIRGLEELEKGLHQEVLQRGIDLGDALGGREAKKITTLRDEVSYWAQRIDQGGDEGERAETIVARFAPHVLDTMDAAMDLQLAEMNRLLEDLQDTFNDIFMDDMLVPPYPQERMITLLGVEGKMVFNYAVNHLTDVKFFEMNSSALTELVSPYLKVCQHYVKSVNELITTDWTYRWKGNAYKNTEVNSLVARLDSVLRNSKLVDEIKLLLSESEQTKFGLTGTGEESIFKSFASMPVLSVGPYTAPQWKSAVREFNRAMQPAESQASSLLKNRIFSLADRPQLLVAEFRNFEQLLLRPSVSKELDSERETLLGQLLAHLEILRNEFESHGQLHARNSTLLTGVNFSELSNGLVWAHQLATKVAETASIVTKVMPDTKGVESFLNSAADLKRSVQKFGKGLFDEWKSTVSADLKSKRGSFRMQTSGKLMELDVANEGKLMVHYSEKLVTLQREVRTVSELGYRVPDSIAAAVAEGEKYYRYGLKLKSVADFYNTMTEQIIPSQMGMLLMEATKFEAAVNANKGVTWDNPETCDDYMAGLAEACDKMVNRNRKLRAQHSNLANQIITLLNTDMMKKAQVWKDTVKKMNATFTKEQKVNTSGSMQVWREHWDHQLLKAFELQFKMALEQLNDKQDFKCDLTFSMASKKLMFRPTLEELRIRYFRGINSFLDLSKTFKAFKGAPPEFFHTIPERNAAALAAVYAEAETLFTQLRRLKDTYKDWVVLGTVDLQQFVLERLSDVSEWEANLKELKKRRKEGERLSDGTKIGCFTVSLVPLKTAVDGQVQALSNALLTSLKLSADKDLAEVEAYLDEGTVVLNTKPTTLEEMGKAQQGWKDLSNQKKPMQQRSIRVQKKNALLKQIAPDAETCEINSLKPKWRTFLEDLEAFNDMLEEQRGELKLSLEKDRDAMLGEVDKFHSTWQALKPNVEQEMTADSAREVIDSLNEWKVKLDELQGRVDKIVADLTNFGDMQIPAFEVLEQVRTDIAENESQWGLYGDFTSELQAMSSEVWVAFRAKIFTFEDFLNAWTKKLKGGRGSVYNYVMSLIRTYRTVWPLLRKCTGELFEDEHWRILFGLCAFAPTLTTAQLTMQHFLDQQEVLLRNAKEINQLSARAQGEVTIREAVQELKVWAEEYKFELLEHETVQKEKTFLIKGWKDLFTKVSDQQSLVSSLKESPYYPPFKDQCVQFEIKIGVLDGCLQSINQIQRKWVYLEPIFGQGALPSEAQRFARIDEDFRDLMGTIGRNPNVLQLATVPNLMERVEMMLDQLDRCQKALNDFLEEKRGKFPRFYFIGDDDLLEILGQAQNPAVIDSHLKKLFMGIHSVDFNEDKTQITAMKSSAKEVVRLIQPVEISHSVETWLRNLASAMEATLKALLIQCAKTPNPDLNKFPSSILDIAAAIKFNLRVEEAIRGGTLQQLHDAMHKELLELTATDTTDSKLLQKKITALVMDHIHCMAVVQLLMDENVISTQDWFWQKQLRHALDDSGQCIIKMVDAQFNYSYEYQGNSGKLVHTPLTDKCYLVLTQGMNLGYGGNPYGPAGTGKTESVKALGAQFGRQVLVFNCDEGIDFKSMGRIFTGLVKSGAWGCFDEFNRLKEDQLSAVSQQIQVIQAALKKGEPTANLLGRTIEVNGNAAIFVTMNPASKEYGGRSKLPHNLKQLFRAVAMSVPDIGLIAETILYSEGFHYATEVGRKVIEVYKLARQLLTPQIHYDWGLRALKTILSHGGQLIHKFKAEGANINLDFECKLCIGALKINTLSKLTYADGLRFKGLIGDVFGELANSEDLQDPQLNAAIDTALKELKMETQPGQIKKILQLHEALNQRMGVVIVGPSGSGKTVMLDVLHRAQKLLGNSIVRHVMNPKALDRELLLGHMDMDTREWFDGVLTASARQVMKEDVETHSWIICDGDIDPEWVESLNSVLDDNRLLTMPNGERIKFGQNVNFIFETHDLQFASPATISRMGMIYLSEEDIDTHSLITAWIDRQPEQTRDSMRDWIEELFHKSLDLVLSFQDFVVPTTKVGIITTALSHIQGASERGEFVVSLQRGLGSNLDLEKRAELAEALFGWAKESLLDGKDPLNITWNKDILAMGTYAHVPREIEADELSVAVPPVVHTVDVQRNQDLVRPWVQRMEPFILVGPEGCGKSLLMHSLFQNMRGTSVTAIHCNAQTSAKNVIQKLRETCGLYSTNKGRVFRPKESDRMVLYLKDLNLPKPDMYDTIQLIALLQQLVSFKGFYDESLEWIGIDKIQICASMNPATTVGRSQLSTRFTAVVHLAFIDYPEPVQLRQVYSAFLSTALALQPKCDVKWKDAANIKDLTTAIVNVFQKVKESFNPDDHRHYLFNPRDITEWVFGVLRYDLGSQNLLDVWAYEAKRMFRDRLVSREAKKRFDQLLNGPLKSVLRHDVDLDDAYFTSLTMADEAVSDSKAVKEMGARLERVTGNDFKELVRDGLYRYEREFKQLNMLLFPEILDHIAFEDRVLSRAGGHLLLIGDSGVGRRSSVTLVAYMRDIVLWTPPMTLNYTGQHFRTDLKELLLRCGVEGTETILYMEDHQFVEEQVLEDLNSLLSSGEVSGLYTPQELDAMLGPIKEDFSMDGRFRNLKDYFVSRVKTNLHICLAMDPSNPKFGLRCESNPGIYNKCTILWMGAWSKQGMTEVPQVRLEPILTNPNNTQQDPEELLSHVIHVHNSMLDKKSSPLKFVGFIKTYLGIYKQKQAKVLERKRHLEGGLLKLNQAAETVDVLSKDAAVKQERVAVKQKEADEALQLIGKKMGVAAERKAEVTKLQGSLGKEEEKLAGRKQAIELELADVEPVLAAAKEAVGGIKKDNLNEIKAFRKPPTAVQHVLESLLTLMGESDLSWKNMKGVMAKPSFKESLLKFDAAKLSAKAIKVAAESVAANAGSFEPERIRHVNVAAAPLAAWVQATIKFATVLRSIKPLRDEFDEANAKLDNARARLQQCQDELKELDDEVQELKGSFSKMTSEAETLKAELNKTEEVLNAAQSLLGKLSGEQKRWDSQVKQLSSDLQQLPLDALLAAGFITYLGPYDEDTRSNMMLDWSDKCGRERFDFMRFMATESELLMWKSQGLPSDQLSMQNGLIIINSAQTPFVIDPNVVAANWLSNTLTTANGEGDAEGDKKVSVEMVLQQEQRFVTTLELAVRFGKVLIVQEADGVLPLLYPILRKDLVRQGPRWVVSIGTKAVDFSDNFRLFLMTRNSAPDLPNFAKSLINEVNFTVTRSGLEGQLLGLTLNHEKPELEQKKSALLAKEESLKIQLAGLEASLLQELATSTGNILENKALIESLDQTKTQSMSIQQALETGQQVQAKLDAEREVYRPIAKTGSVLFFLVAQLTSVNNMYETSLPAFSRLFNKNMAAVKVEAGEKPKARIKKLNQALVLLVFQTVMRSLFKTDRLMFGMHLVHCIFKEDFKPNEWELFTGELAGDLDGGKARLPEWADSSRQKSYTALAKSHPSLVKALQLEDAHWKSWATNPRCELDFPQTGKTSLFQRLLVIQALRPDRLQSAIHVYVCEALGVKSVAPPPLNFQVLVDESSNSEPILFIATAGADPTADLEDFAIKKMGKDGFSQLAMGSGQMDTAVAMLTDAAERGTWVCLKNLHLVISWLPELEKTLKMLDLKPSFRLWLTTEPHANFPSILLQSSLKVTYESPPGVKQNLLRTYEGWDTNFVAQGSALRAQLLFILAWFHALVQERRTYLPQGFTKFYEFSTADLRSGSDVITNICNGMGENNGDVHSLPWTTLWGVMEFAIYGGRIDSDSDARVVVAYLRKFFHTETLGRRRALLQGVVVPNSTSRAEYVRLIEALPSTDLPALFGLPENIEGSAQQTQSAALCTQLRKLTVSASMTSKFDRESWRQALQPFMALWNKLCSANGGTLLQKPLSVTREEEDLSPVDGFVMLENDNIFRLIGIVNKIMTGLDSLLTGTGLLTNELYLDGSTLLQGETPWRWARNWYGPENPTLWMTELASRKQALGEWLQLVERNTLLHDPISLSALFKPGTFLNALRQQTARVSKTPIDELKLVVTWSNLLLPKNTKLTVTVEGMYMQGCTFVDSVLGKLAPDAPSMSLMPPVTLAYIRKSDPEPYPDDKKALSVPLYTSPSREEFVCDFRCPSSGTVEEWIIAGVALFLCDVK